MHQIVVVTWNNDKFYQIASIIDNVAELSQDNRELIEPQSEDMLFVSRSKALQAFESMQKPILVDDSWIYFEAYHKFPGVLSKYIYQSLGMIWLKRLFHEEKNTRAYFQCVLSYMDGTLSEPIQFVGKVYGNVSFDNLSDAEVNQKMPYNAGFIADGMNTTAKADPETFYTIHHRANATHLFKDRLISK